MRKSTPVGVRVNPNLKKMSEESFRRLGMNMHAGINLLLSQMVLYQRLPFDVNLSVPSQTVITDEKTVALMVMADEQIKRTCTELAKKAGLSLSLIVNMYLVQVVDKQAIPFEIVFNPYPLLKNEAKTEIESEI